MPFIIQHQLHRIKSLQGYILEASPLGTVDIAYLGPVEDGR